MSDVEGRSLCLDFKGLRDAVPTVLGIQVEGTFESVVTDVTFGDAALAKDLRVNSFADEISAIVARCRREARRIFGFSHDTSVTVAQFAHAGAAFDELFEDARELGLLWHEKVGRPGAPDWALADFLADMGQPLPKRLAPKHTTSRVRYVGQALQRHGRYDAISGGAKAKWTRLLQQSASDTQALQSFVLRAGRELAGL